MSKNKILDNVDKLKLIEENIEKILKETYHYNDYLKENDKKHYLNEIIIKNQNDLLRDHIIKINNIKYSINFLYNFILIIFLIYSNINIYIYFIKK